MDGNVDGLTYTNNLALLLYATFSTIELLLGELFNVDAPSKSVYLSDLTLVALQGT